jgi:hypothetical protein
MSNLPLPMIISPSETQQFLEELRAARIEPSSPRAHRAVTLFKDGVPAQDAIAQAVQDEDRARQAWVDAALKPWCDRHGISLEQGLSIAFFENIEADASPTMADLFKWSGQQNAFALRLMADIRLARSQAEQAGKVEIPAYALADPDRVEAEFVHDSPRG